MNQSVAATIGWVRSKWRLGSLLLLLTAFANAGCESLISRYDHTAYENATSIKAEALMLMSKATEEYSDHQAAAEQLMLRVEQAYEYANGIPKNEDSTAQWRIMRDPQRNLLGGFMMRWRNEGTLPQAFVTSAKDDVVGPAFDEVIRLEINKLGANN